MNDRIRVLLLESNRYRALLLQRALHHYLPEAIVVRFDKTAPALEELAFNAYDAAVINLDAVSGPDAEHLHEFIAADRRTGVVLLQSRETPQVKATRSKRRPGVPTFHVDESTDQVASAVWSILKLSRFGVDFDPKSASPHLSRLALAGQ